MKVIIRFKGIQFEIWKVRYGTHSVPISLSRIVESKSSLISYC